MKLPARILLLPALTLVFAGCAAKDEPSSTGTTDTKTPAKTTETPKTTEQPKTTEEPKTADPAPATAKKYTKEEWGLAKEQMKVYCATCHGLSGKGDGAAAAAMNPKPRDWTDPKWHDSVTDEKIFGVIKDGGIKHGLSPLMAPMPMHQDKPGVIHALVKMIRKLKT